ncbi:hypothetical protein P7C73_g1779, partial [Tremellales sp. Uapishka_1]
MSSTAPPRPPLSSRRPSRSPLVVTTPLPSSSLETEYPSRPALNPSRPQSAIFLGVDARISPPARPSTLRNGGSGFAGVKVGLGSPSLGFPRESQWPGGRYRGEGGNHVEHSATGYSETTQRSPDKDLSRSVSSVSSGSSRGPRGALVDDISGLPSPPGTESDIALPKANPSETNPPLGSSPAMSSPRPRSSRTASLSSSPSTLKRSESPRLRPHVLRPKNSPPLSRTSSSSSGPLAGEIVSSPLRAGADNRSSRSKRSSLDANSPVSGPSSSTVRRSTALHSTASPAPSSSSKGSSSPTKRHYHSPSLPQLDTSPRPSPSRRGSWRRSSSGTLDLTPTDASPHGPSLPATHWSPNLSGDDIDERIRLAEEKLAKRERITPSRSSMRRFDSMASPPKEGASSSIRRSATLTEGGPSATRRRGEGTMGSPLKKSREFEDDKDNSNGSNGSGGRRKPLPMEFRQGHNGSLFTPSPKPTTSSYSYTHQDPPQSARSRISDRDQGPEDSPLRRYRPDVPSPSRHTASRSTHLEALERTASLTSGYTRRQWNESISGLPRSSLDLDGRGLPLPRTRAESVMGLPRGDRAGNRYPYEYRGGSAESALTEKNRFSSSSRLGLTPADSVSAVGSRNDATTTTTKRGKDPLEVIRKIEDSRMVHNRQWEDRASSVLGLTDRPASRMDTLSHRHIPRPSTSMSSMREPPRTAPAYRREFQEISPESPSYGRGASRLGHHTVNPTSEPRPMRSSTSMGSNGELGTAGTEHGRLLFGAFRSLEAKLGGEGDLIKGLGSTTRSAETISSNLRSAMEALNKMMGSDSTSISGETWRNLKSLLRETSRHSDQNVRDLTRVLLDLPKVVDPSLAHRIPASTSRSSLDGYRDPAARRWRPLSPRDSTPSRSGTSMSADLDPSPTHRFQSVVSRVRGPNHPHGNGNELTTIQASPPQPHPQADSPPARKVSSPLKASPSRLRKKASTISNHTVRGSGSGSGSFFPTMPRAGTTTAISQITVGDNSDAGAGGQLASSPRSRYSFNSEGDEDSVSVLERRLAKNMRVRDGEREGEAPLVRRPSISERFKSHLMRGSTGET